MDEIGYKSAEMREDGTNEGDREDVWRDLRKRGAGSGGDRWRETNARK